MQSDLTKHILNLLPRGSKKAGEESLRNRAAVAEAEHGRAELERLKKELEIRLAERTAELEAAKAALLSDVEKRRALEVRMRHAESIGTLAGAIAHDLNNILNVIQGYASLIASQTGENAEIAESVNVINDAVNRGAAVVEQLRVLARAVDPNLDRVDINGLLAGVAELRAVSDRRSTDDRESDGNERKTNPARNAEHSATALVVEDDEAALHLLRNVLADRGYRVLTAIDGEEAASRYVRNGDDIDVVLLDLDLPKISGTEVLRKIHAKNPNARVIITSGYLDPELKAALIHEGVTHFIPKPYMPEEIIAAINGEQDRPVETAGVDSR